MATLTERLSEFRVALANGATATVLGLEWDAERNRFRTDRPDIEITGDLRDKVLAAAPLSDRLYHDGTLGVCVDGVWYRVEMSPFHSSDLRSDTYLQAIGAGSASGEGE